MDLDRPLTQPDVFRRCGRLSLCGDIRVRSSCRLHCHCCEGLGGGDIGLRDSDTLACAFIPVIRGGRVTFCGATTGCIIRDLGAWDQILDSEHRHICWRQGDLRVMSFSCERCLCLRLVCGSCPLAATHTRGMSIWTLRNRAQHTARRV